MRVRSLEMTMGFLWRSRNSLIYLTAGISALLCSAASLAAERVVLKYGPLSQSIPVADLTTFAQTGDFSQLEGYGISENDAANVRSTLTKQVKIDVRLLDRGLNNPLGDVLLDKIGESIQTPTGDANRQALRSALILSAGDDGQISMLEVIQKYPTREVNVDVMRLSKAYSQLAKFEGQVRKVMSVVDLFN